MPTYSSLSIEFKEGHGCWLVDTNFNVYLDASAGLAVTNLGHCHPDINDALFEQAKKLFHVSDQYYISQQYDLATKLCNISGLDQAFFCNSGAEANETAIKLARLYGRYNKIKSPIIVTMRHGFHGRTMGNVSQAIHDANSYEFSPLMPGFLNISFNDIKALSKCLSENNQVVAIILEPIQGHAGVIMPDPKYLQMVRELCSQHQVLLILDEVQTGCGRTGKFFAYQHHHIQPDILTVAKGLGNGLPIGACLAKKEVSQLFKPGQHGSTFGGNPMCCAVASKVCECISNKQFLLNVLHVGQYLLNELQSKLSDRNTISAIRGSGLLIAIEYKYMCQKLPEIALKHYLLINVIQKHIIRLTPALIITKTQCDLLISRLIASLNEYEHEIICVKQDKVI